MFEELYEEVRDVQNRVLEEFVQGLPSTFIEADFEVEQLRLQVCFRRKYIDFEELLLLSADVEETCKIWKKLNDK